jgi:serpin B
MRFFILIALCLTVASATYTSRNRFNRLIRNLQHQQGYGNQGRNLINDIDDYYGNDHDQYESDEDDYYQQRQQCNRYDQECDTGLDRDNVEYDSDESQDDDDYSQQYQHQGRHHQTRRNQHQTRAQQQRHRCTPKYHLLQELEQTNTHLASKLYKQAKQENDDKNTVVSPSAIQLALAAIAHGAQGNTHRQIRRVIGAALTRQQNRQAHAALHQALHGQDPRTQQTGRRQHAQVKTTTTIVINQRNRAQQQFIQAVHVCLNTQVKKCDFQHQPQQCRQQINRYVAQKTQHKLQHVVPQDAVTTNTKMVVVSTTHVTARWGHQFRQQQQTKTGRFHPLGSQNNAKHVQVIQSQGQFNYYEDEQLHIVGVPTKQEELTLYVIIPKDKDGLNQIEKEHIQNGQQLKELLEQAEQQQHEIDIELPKFQIKHKIDAKQTLRKEGIEHAFDADEADFSGINGHHGNTHRQQIDDEDNEYESQQQGRQSQNQLHVNKLVHQATIKVDENGIHAAQSKNQHYQTRYNQEYDHDETENNDEDDDENDEHLQNYRRQQLERDEMLEEIFGQQYTSNSRRHNNQRRHHGRQHGHHENQGEKKIKVNRAFAFALKHNPSNQIVLVGRVVDVTQKPKNQHQQIQLLGQQSLNGVDQQ